jgi:transcriptional regulator with XRE-family HTH domain
MSALNSVPTWDTEPREESGSRVLSRDALGAWVRRTRNAQAMAVRALATRTHLSTSFISQVENGVVSPSIASMEKICHALGATLADCFAAASGAEQGFIVRRAERAEVASSWTQARVETLAPAAGSRLEPLLITLDPGGRSAHDPCPHAIEEFFFILMGHPTLVLGAEEHQLDPSDAVTIRARDRRRWENRTSSVVKVLCVSAS